MKKLNIGYSLRPPNLGRLIFNQSSPVHTISEYRGCPLSMTKDKGQTTKGCKSLCLILDRDVKWDTLAKRVEFTRTLTLKRVVVSA